MRLLLIILFIGSTTISYQQRPDLTLGVNAKFKLLHLINNSTNIISPGADLQLHVNKRNLLGGVNLGYSVLFTGNSLGSTPQHLINTDLVIGWMIIRKPSLKIGLNGVFSYSISLNRKSDLKPNTHFYRNNVNFLPELYFTYKAARLSLNYFLPLFGNQLYGFGFDVGIRF